MKNDIKELMESATRPRIPEGTRLVVEDPRNKNHYWLSTVKFVKENVLYIELDNGAKYQFFKDSHRVIGKGVDKVVTHPILKEEIWKFIKSFYVKPDEDMIAPENMRYLKKG